ncbi:MAG: ribosome silencing factor [Muribaculaceae bacterium]|nr:ribosome silencing factor [Muribaculaceae bacterium]
MQNKLLTTNENTPKDRTVNLTNESVRAIQDKKGGKISVVDLSRIETAPASRFVICEANSTSQVTAIADNVREELRKNLGMKPYNYDGYRNSQWIVIDYGEVIVHVFQRETREYYNIEDLWSDAEIEQIPDLD